MEMLLSRCDGNRRYYSMSRVIRSHRSEYYAVLERTETGSLDITIYLEWFLRTYMEAIEYSEKSFVDVLARTRIWDGLRGLDLNERQHRIIGMLIDGFDGKLTAEKWARICRCSHATAVRDINALIASGVLSRDEGKARKASYSLIRP